MTYFYEVGFGTYEESGKIALFHAKQYTQKQFENMIVKVAPSAAIKSFEEYNKPRSNQSVVVYAGMQISDIYEEIANQLCEKFGFARVSFDVSSCMWGWTHVFEIEKGWEGQQDSLTKRVNKEIVENCPEQAKLRKKEVSEKKKRIKKLTKQAKAT